MRLMRQVYLCINTSSQDSHQRCSSLERQPTNHFTLILSQAVGCTRMLKFNHHSPPSPSPYFYIIKQTSRLLQTAVRKRKSINSPSLKHFLPFLLPPTVKTESAGLVTRVMWKTLDQYPLTPLHWALGRAEICMGSLQ